MSEFDREEIGRIVREVLAEWLAGRKVPEAPPRKAPPDDAGPRVLFLFNAGVRKLDTALDQTALIQAAAGKTGVYTGPSARGWVCGGDVRSATGARCILDTVAPDGVEKVLERADVLVLPTLCLTVASKVAHLITDDQESRLVARALLQGKKVLAANDGFLICDILANGKIKEEIQAVLAKLEGFGMTFSETAGLERAFGRLFEKNGPEKHPGSERKATDKKESAARLITAKMVTDTVSNHQSEIRVPPRGMITPLAADLAREHGVRILKR